MRKRKSMVQAPSDAVPLISDCILPVLSYLFEPLNELPLIYVVKYRHTLTVTALLEGSRISAGNYPITMYKQNDL